MKKFGISGQVVLGTVMDVILRDANNSESCRYVDVLDVGVFTGEKAAKPTTAVQDCIAASVRVTPLDFLFERLQEIIFSL